MKKILLSIAVLMMTACNGSKYGMAGDNAIQYVYEQMSDKRADINSVEIIKEDSVLSPILLSFGTTEIYSERTKYLGGEVSIEQYSAFKDSMMIMEGDVAKSWVMDKEWTDSLKKLPKYDGAWRKAFWLEVTMKSNQKLQYRMCLDQDGVTPYTNADGFMKEHQNFVEALNE